MKVFIDTSALLAVLDGDDDNHSKAKAAWEKLLTSDEILVTSNYVLVETFALVQNRLGMEAARAVQEDVVPVLMVRWIDEIAHRAAVSSLLAASRRKLSLVDCTSFEVMRQEGIKRAFTFDSHFKEQGFEPVSARQG